MGNELFRGLETFGLSEDIISRPLYNSKEETSAKKQDTEEVRASVFYEKTVNCPVCRRQTKIKAVKTGSSRVMKIDSDFMVQYSGINPLLYEVMFCKLCGYAALPAYFKDINDKQREMVLKNITLKWKSVPCPDEYDIDTAIRLFKLALLNAAIKDSKASEKAAICLKISWLYRQAGNNELEKVFQAKSVEGFEYAYENESFPIAGLDRWNTIYIIGELYRRTGDYNNSMKYFSQILFSKASNRLKDKVRELRDMMKEDTK